MKRIFQSAILMGLIVLASCQSEVEKKKAKYEELKQELLQGKGKLDQLEKEITELDPEWKKGNEPNALLVKIEKIKKQPYVHKILARGAVESRQNVEVGAESTGRILQVFALEGKVFKKGQPLVIVDSESIKNQIDEVQINYDLANEIYLKRKRLRENNVGTEVEFLEAKNKKEALEKQLKTLRTNLEYTVVKAPFDGTVDEVFVRQGQVTANGSPLLRFVSLKDMYALSNASERYLGTFSVGDSVDVEFPTLGKTMTLNIDAIGKVIDKVSRTFTVEARIPSGQPNIQPNMVTIMKIADYYNPDAVVVPTNVILEDKHGNYVYTISKDDLDRTVAEKKYVVVESDYEGDAYVSEGLEENDVIIINGHRQATPNTIVQIVK
ncbi:efflux RND transporter periplasmic adaptor subunit [Aureibacter tunicatorum]|uniref:RND family efflux transporter MFP subunit n=1 Tax=Aureibacter tunicatorum TaxID=866807 RepID=A0AAE3XKH5_9BACT|nr:efflux RND transporter periplasmic adaptor subunit [Aureibacter tunicatorum]MDR6238293.1 RND family efflux transporter MFP subunit [Aureibacter tunicatorum]BDD03326.1 RND transporter [Aureibacter tunicatorum]